jgi:hypothetical protein
MTDINHPELIGAIYDNPNSERREHWQQGYITAAVSRNFLEDTDLQSMYFGPLKMHKLMSGNWKPGNLYGDKSHITEAVRP